MADGEGSTDHLARRCENRHRPPASRRANTYTCTHTHGCRARTNTCWRARARSQSRLRGRRKFLECVGGETAATGNAMDDRAAIVALCQICLRNRLN